MGKQGGRRPGAGRPRLTDERKQRITVNFRVSSEDAILLLDQALPEETIHQVAKRLLLQKTHLAIQHCNTFHPETRTPCLLIAGHKGPHSCLVESTIMTIKSWASEETPES